MGIRGNQFETSRSTIQFIRPEIKGDGVHLTLGQTYNIVDKDVLSVTLPPSFTRLIQSAISMFVHGRGAMLYQDHVYHYNTAKKSTRAIRITQENSEGSSFLCIWVTVSLYQEFMISLDRISCRNLYRFIVDHIKESEFMNGPQYQIDWVKSKQYGNALWYGELFVKSYYQDDLSTLIIHQPKDKELAKATFEIHQQINGEDLVAVFTPDETHQLVAWMEGIVRRFNDTTDSEDQMVSYDPTTKLYTVRHINESDTDMLTFVCTHDTLQEIVLRVKY